MMPKPILYLSQLGGLGGGESSLLTHLRALERTRWAPRVICGTAGEFVDELRAYGVPVDVMPFQLPHFKRGLIPVATPAFLPRLLSYLRTHRVALIHCNDPESAYYAAPLAKIARVPVVWTSWGWWQAERGWKSRFYERFFARILTPTAYIKQCLVAANLRLEPRITVLPFGVDTHEYSPGPRDESLLEEFQLLRDVPIITLLARFHSVKGHAVLLDAAPPILNAVPSARFLFVGDATFDTDDARATQRAIQARVASDGRLNNAIVFCGFRRDVPRILRATDVLVCPSDSETYGMANLEAMACGVPVVSTAVGGPAETIVDGETGFLVPPQDPQALAARVIALLGDPGLRQRMGQNGRCRVERQFSLEQSVAALERIYAELVGR